MVGKHWKLCWVPLLAVLGFVTPASAQSSIDAGVIHLGNTAEPDVSTEPDEKVNIVAARHGFDYDSFQSRLESLWFQRKTYLASQRYDDANEQLEKIRTFSAREGVRRLEHLSGALLAEARRSADEGNYDQALTALRFAEAFDEGRPQVRLARAKVHWESGSGYLAAGPHLISALRASVVQGVQELSLFHQLLYIFGVATICSLLIFSLFMLYRYQVPFRHEIEEWAVNFSHDRWPRIIGWAVLLFPLLSWVGAGWAVMFWIIVLFRFMSRSERVAGVLLLTAIGLTTPFHRVTVALYGTTADPAVRTTISSVGGEYSPERIVKLRQLVEQHRDDPVYHFLLAGLYKNGRYFEEAFDEYKQALQLDPRLSEAYVNIGNIFYTTGQFGEAVANYRRAVEVHPDSFLAYFNMHLAQSEAFRFQPAEESLQLARQIDTRQVARLLRSANNWGDRPAVQDAWIEMSSVWEAALDGERYSVSGTEQKSTQNGRSPFDALAWAALIAIVACGLMLALNRVLPPARRCIRCGRPFCHHCKSGREAREYCSQCVHLYVLGDGLAPGVKSRKVFEVERFERFARRSRRAFSILIPGTAQLAQGRALWGTTLMALWFCGLIAVRPSFMATAAGWLGIELRLDLLRVPGIPALYDSHPLALVAILGLPLIWVAANSWRWRSKEV